MQKAGLESNLDERRIGEGFDRCHALSTRMAALCHFDMGGMMALDRERQIDVTRFLESPGDESKIDFLDAMFAERTAQAFPERLARCKDECTRRIDIEPMHDTRPKTALSDSDHLFTARDDRIQDGVVLIRPKRMDSASGGLVDDEPTRALGDESPIEIRAWQRPLVFRP